MAEPLKQDDVIDVKRYDTPETEWRAALVYELSVHGREADWFQAGFGGGELYNLRRSSEGRYWRRRPTYADGVRDERAEVVAGLKRRAWQLREIALVRQDVWAMVLDCADLIEAGAGPWSEENRATPLGPGEMSRGDAIARGDHEGGERGE